MLLRVGVEIDLQAVESGQRELVQWLSTNSALSGA
jgi:hypothetical protein